MPPISRVISSREFRLVGSYSGGSRLPPTEAAAGTPIALPSLETPFRDRGKGMEISCTQGKNKQVVSQVVLRKS